MLADETIFLNRLSRLYCEPFAAAAGDDGGRFLLLVQPAFAERAQAEIANIAAANRQIESQISRLLIRRYYRTQSRDCRTRIWKLRVPKSTIVFHLAAIYDLAVARDLGLARERRRHAQRQRRLPVRCHGLRHYHYVSTCYVAGKRTGRILET